MEDIIKPGEPLKTHFHDYEGLTREDIMRIMPKNINKPISDEMIKVINRMGEDCGIMQEYLEENFLSNLNVLQEKRISVKHYVNAIKFVALRQNYSLTKSWAIVFPDKYKALKDAIDGGADSKQINIAAHASSYAQTKAVVKVTAQSILAPSIVYAPMHHHAVTKLYNLTNGVASGYPLDAENKPPRVSPTVQLNAAIALEQITRVPEDTTINLKVEQGDAHLEQQKKLNENIRNLIDLQRKGIESGKNVTEVQKVFINNDDDYDDAEVM